MADAQPTQSYQTGAPAEVVADEGDEAKCLLFRLGGALFAAKLIDIQEVLLPQAVRIVPRTPEYFCGVMNIRGQVVSVVSLLKFFGIPSTAQEEMLLLVNSTSGPVACFVEKVESVTFVTEARMANQMKQIGTIPLEHLIGVSEHAGELLLLVDLKKLAASIDLALSTSQTRIPSP